MDAFGTATKIKVEGVADGVRGQSQANIVDAPAWMLNYRAQQRTIGTSGVEAITFE